MVLWRQINRNPYCFQHASLRSLLTPAQLEGIACDDLVREVTSFYDPKPSLIMQQYLFNSRVRASRESIASYVAALHKLTEHCSYGDTMEEMIPDRLMCGVNHA